MQFSLKNISWKQAINIVLIVAVLVLIGQNLGNVMINIFVWRFEIPLFILVIVIFVIGFYSALAFGSGVTHTYTLKDGKIIDKKVEEVKKD